jgi:purine-binding chemotaxis protein CheW
MAEKFKETDLDDDLYDEDEDSQKDKYLTFHLGAEDYGIEIACVTEIIGIQKITEVPDMPDFVKGVINLRGKVIPVMDMRLRFKMEEQEYHDRTCIVVVDIKDTSVGLVVDAVNEVSDIPEADIDPPPSTGKSTSSRYIQGLGKMEEEVKILLKVDQILFEEEMAAIEAAA